MKKNLQELMFEARAFYGIRIVEIGDMVKALRKTHDMLSQADLCRIDEGEEALKARLEKHMEALVDPTCFTLIQERGKILEGTAWSLVMHGYYAELVYNLDHINNLLKPLYEGKNRFEVPITPDGALDFCDFTGVVMAGKNRGVEVSLPGVIGEFPSFLLWEDEEE